MAYLHAIRDASQIFHNPSRDKGLLIAIAWHEWRLAAMLAFFCGT
jgi:hypothetical protein